jgi:hypothetical protein
MHRWMKQTVPNKIYDNISIQVQTGNHTYKIVTDMEEAVEHVTQFYGTHFAQADLTRFSKFEYCTMLDESLADP